MRARIAGETQESLSELSAITQETLSVSGILLSKSFNRQRTESARYQDENRNQVRLQVRRAMSGQGFFAVVQVLMASVPAVIYLVAGYIVTGSAETLTAGTIVAFTTVQARLLMPLMGLMRVALDLQTSAALFARIFEYLDLVPAIQDAPGAIPVSEAPGPVGRVEFRDVVFRYPDAAPGARPTLDGVSFTAEPGRHVAFVGPSGAGKTTVLYLTPRMYEASAGQVLFAGEDVRRLTQESIIDNVGIVSQETYLFHATIRENLRYAKPEATDAELEDACRAANIHHIIESFEHGLRHGRGRARLSPLRRREAAHRDRARAAEGSRRSSSSTRRRRRSTPSRSGSSKRRWMPRPAAARRSRSPTGSRPSSAPTSSTSSTPVASSSRARTPSSSRATASTPSSRRSSSRHPAC